MSAPREPSQPLGDLVAAHFQRLEVAMLARVLTTTLAGALPPALVRVERRRRFGSRRGGAPIGVSITSGDRTLTFRAPDVGVVEASVSHTVHGVVLSTTPLTVAQWLAQLGEVLDELSRQDGETREALEKALLPAPAPSAPSPEPPQTPPALPSELPPLRLEPPSPDQ